MSPAVVALTLGSAAAFLGLGVLAAIRGGRSALGLQLSLMCLTMSSYNAFDAASELTSNGVTFGWLACTAAALLAIPTWHLMVGFVGISRRMRWSGRLVSVYFAGVAISSLLPFAIPELATYPSGARWALAM